MTGSFTVALAQMNAGRELKENLAQAEDLIRQAKDRGAQLVVTPENTSFIETERALTLEKALPADGGDARRHFATLAQELGLWIHVGSLTCKADAEQCFNRAFLIAPDGSTVATYDKIHMFDVTVGDGQTYRESATFRAGSKAVVADLPWGRYGLSICYDIRFAYLYRILAKAGANFISAPAAFTQVTGEAHWHVLQRARAIETGSFIFSAAQCGTHAKGRKTFGHSLVVAPWGEVLADGGTEVGIVTAKIDPALSHEARSKIPALTHDREIEPPSNLRLAGE